MVFLFLASVTPLALGAEAGNTLARWIPADVRAFAEIHGLAKLEQLFGPNGEWGAWTQLAAGQTSRPAVTVEWAQRFGRIMGMSLPEAARDLFGRQVAIAAPSYDALAEGVVLAEAPSPGVIARLLTKNQAKPQPPIGNVSCYTLKEGLSLGVRGTTLLLGQRQGNAGLFERTAALLGGQEVPCLAEAPRYIEQLRRLPAGARGVLFLDFPAPPATRPEETSPESMLKAEAIWSTLQRLVIGMYEEEAGLDLQIRGLTASPTQRTAEIAAHPLKLDPIARLPESTLLVWARSIDLIELYRGFISDRDPQQSILRYNLEVIQAILRPADVQKDILGKLGPQVMLVWGHKQAKPAKMPEAVDIPLVSIIIEAREADATAAMLQRLGERFLGWLKVEFARARQDLDLTVEQTTYQQTVIYHVPIGNMFKGSTLCPYLHTVEISWASVGGWLVLSTHPDHIRQLVDSWKAKPEQTFAATPAYKALQKREGVSGLLLMRPSASADLLQSWIDYCARNAPQVLEPLWWKRILVRRMGRRVELGIIIKEGSEPGRVAVGSPVLPEMPAAGRILPGDKICAVDGVTLSEEHPEEDLRDLVALRSGPGVVLRVEREGKLLDVRIPLAPPSPLPIGADWDPVRSIRYLIGLGHGLDVAGYIGTQPKAGVFDATVVLRMNAGGHAPSAQAPATTGPASAAKPAVR